MILQRLAEHYDRLAADPRETSRLPKRGYSLQKVSFCVVLNRDGALQQIESLLDAGRGRAIPRQLLVPGESKPTGSGVNPGFLWDNAEYVLGLPKDEARAGDDRYLARVDQSFRALRDRHLALADEIPSDSFRAVCEFLRQWDPLRALPRLPDLRDLVSHFGVFRMAGAQQYVHDDPAVRAYWARGQAASDGEEKVEGTCLVTGARTELARLHEPKIKGVSGAQSSGALLVSFNEDAYTSYGRDQSYNAPVGEEAAFKYAAALNWLLGEQNRRIQLGDATAVFWAERPTSLEGFVSELLGGAPPSNDSAAPEDERRREQVRLFLSQVRAGLRSVPDAGLSAEGEKDVPFWILALSPNASRLSVRFWLETSAGELALRLAQHLEDVDLRGRRDDDAPLSVRRLVQASGRADVVKGRVTYDSDSISPLLAASLARAVLFGTPYPHSLLTAMLGRLRADGAITHDRIAAIKGCLVRNARFEGRSQEVSVSLDLQRADPAYVTGRVFALLEKIQEDSADGELNVTIKDRFFSSASATPSVVFPRLLRLSQHHLSKMDIGKRIWYEKQLHEAMGKLDGFTNHLRLEDQGLFAIGYYHQRQHFFRKKDQADNAGDDT
ncbi:MAG: type I-C CRISPR-associated protein Cas8c/Csd1 [Gemmatimonadaceae bacterium]